MFIYNIIDDDSTSKWRNSVKMTWCEVVEVAFAFQQNVVFVIFFVVKV